MPAKWSEEQLATLQKELHDILKQTRDPSQAARRIKAKKNLKRTLGGIKARLGTPLFKPMFTKSMEEEVVEKAVEGDKIMDKLKAMTTHPNFDEEEFLRYMDMFLNRQEKKSAAAPSSEDKKRQMLKRMGVNVEVPNPFAAPPSSSMVSDDKKRQMLKRMGVNVQVPNPFAAPPSSSMVSDDKKRMILQKAGVDLNRPNPFAGGFNPFAGGAKSLRVAGSHQSIKKDSTHKSDKSLIQELKEALEKPRLRKTPKVLPPPEPGLTPFRRQLLEKLAARQAKR